jgi:hypothetical protein
MPQRSHPVRITILFDAADYRIFVSATRQLRRIMGRNAPDVTALIGFNLQDRDATGLADDYLDAIRWPSSAGRVVTLRTQTRSNRSTRSDSRGARPTARTKSPNPPAPDDPSRN